MKVLVGFFFGFMVSVSTAAISDSLSVAAANQALASAGGMVGNIFAVGENRYQVMRSRITGKRGENVFIGEIEIHPLPKH